MAPSIRWPPEPIRIPYNPKGVGHCTDASSRENYREQIGTAGTYAGEELKIAADCKAVQDEGNEEKTDSYCEYIEMREISETDNVAGIYMAR